MADRATRKILATLDRLHRLKESVTGYLEACRSFGNMLVTWRDERMARQKGYSTILTAPTVTFDELVQHKEAAMRAFKTLEDEFESAMQSLDGLAKTIGPHYNQPGHYETRLRRSLKVAKRELTSAYFVILMPDQTLSKEAEEHPVWAQSLIQSCKKFSEAFYGEVLELTEWLDCIHDSMTGGDAEDTTPTKNTSPEEAQVWAENYIKNHPFPGRNALAKQCGLERQATCSPSTMGDAIKNSKSLLSAKANHKLKSGNFGPKPKPSDDPAHLAMVDETLRTILESYTKSERNDINAEQLRLQLIKKSDDELNKLAKNAKN